MLAITSLGDAAHACLEQLQVGVVHSVYARCAYLQFNDSLLCLGLTSLGRGPLNALFDRQTQTLPRAIYPGAVVYVNRVDNIMRINTGVDVNYAHATVSDSSAELLQLDVSTYRTHQHALAQMHSPAIGVLPLVLSMLSSTDPTYRYAAQQTASSVDLAFAQFTLPRLHDLLDWLRWEVSGHAGHGAPPVRIRSLLGAGPGLTPAGDDLLAGVLLTLRLAGYTSSSDTLWAHLHPSVCARTNKISASLLQQAAAGRAGEWAQAALGVFTATGRLATEELATLLARMGGSSGWDFLAGVVLVLDAAASNDAVRCASTAWPSERLIGGY